MRLIAHALPNSIHFLLQPHRQQNLSNPIQNLFCNSYAFSSNDEEDFITGADGRRILRLRNDDGTVNTSKISATQTKATDEATETVIIIRLLQFKIDNCRTS